VVGVAVEGVQGEMLAGVLEVVLLPPPVAHPVSDLGRREVVAAGQDRGLVPVRAGSDDQLQRDGPRRYRRRMGGRVLARDRQRDRAFGEMMAVAAAVRGGEVDREARVAT
jgi:hypothetical protein